MQVLRVTPGSRVPARLVGAVLARDLTVAGERWSKGRRLTADDLAAIERSDPGDPVSVLLPDPGEIHDVSKEKPDLTRKLRHLLDANHSASYHRGAEAAPPPITPEQAEALRALGYVN